VTHAAHACTDCIARSWLLARLSAHLERVRARIEAALALSDEQLIRAVGGREQLDVRLEYLGLDVGDARARAASAGLELICRCDRLYPERLHGLPSPPALLHLAGGLDRFASLARQDPVAIVGSRRASPYGLEVARSLGRSLASSGITVLSGMALGVDSAAHTGALDAGAGTIAVLPGAAERPYPASKRNLYRQIIATGVAVSELPPETRIARWMFPARNRIIAALAAMTVVGEAGERSGALVTARLARRCGRPVGAVPGRITSPGARGSNALLADGARIVRGPQDVLDQLFGAGVRSAQTDDRARLAPDLGQLLSAIGEGRDTLAALERTGFPTQETLAALAMLELEGYVRRLPGGRFAPIP
jgi:DNA processing protein